MAESGSRGASGGVRTCSIPVDPDLGCKRVVVELSVPTLPGTGAPVRFAEHVQQDGRPTDTVIALSRGAAVVSEDLGENWERVPVPELGDVTFRNAFTTASGTHLLQGDTSPDGEPATRHGYAPVALLDSNWQLVDCADPGFSIWHGSRSIDEAGGTIIYAEYPTNAARPILPSGEPGPAPSGLAPLRDSCLLRSTDGGRSWRTVLRHGWQTIRHFHTVAADPWRGGRWWASSGDGPHQCRVWESLDDGVSWDQLPVELPVDELHPSLEQTAQSILRHTDVVVRETDLIWGSDDLLGEAHLGDAAVEVERRAGARLFTSPKERPWKPRSIGYVGDAVRSLVDVGPGYLVLTQAKGALGFRPRVFLLWKQEPFGLTPLFTVDNFRGSSPATGFTYSRASREAKDGVFFTHRSAADVFDGGAGMLRWRVLFD